MTDAAVWIEKLELQPHPEGGFYRETYRGPDTIKPCCLADGYDGPRSVSTAIYFLLDGEQVSRFHRLRSDELWHHYAGCALDLHVIRPGGAYERERVGRDVLAGEAPQAVISAGAWFGATLSDRRSFALLGCTNDHLGAKPCSKY